MLRSLLEESAPIQNQMVVIDYIGYLVLLLVNYEKNVYFSKSKEIGEKVYNMRKKLFGEKHPLTENTLNN